MYNGTFPSKESVYINSSFSIIITVLAIGGNSAMMLIYMWKKELRDFNNTGIPICYITETDYTSVIGIFCFQNHVSCTFFNDTILYLYKKNLFQ